MEERKETGMKDRKMENLEYRSRLSKPSLDKSCFSLEHILIFLVYQHVYFRLKQTLAIFRLKIKIFICMLECHIIIFHIN